MSLSLRPLQADDAQAVADLIGDYDAFHNDSGDRPSAQDILDWWARIDAWISQNTPQSGPPPPGTQPPGPSPVDETLT